MKVRLIEEVGRRTSLVGVWGEGCTSPWGRHRCEIDRQEHPGVKMGEEPKQESRYVTEGDDIHCQYCVAKAPVNTFLGQSSSPLWSSGEDKPKPGDMYWANWYHSVQEDGSVHCRLQKWDNCNDPRGHLIVVLPNGCEWDIDSRASNCTREEDRAHRCWVRHGEPPHIHVDKNGDTCSAGAGSIISVDWHGFLHNGELVQC